MLVQIPSLSHSFIVFRLSLTRTINFSTLSLFSLWISWFKQYWGKKRGERCVGRIQGRRTITRKKRFALKLASKSRKFFENLMQGNFPRAKPSTCADFFCIRRGESPPIQNFLKLFSQFSFRLHCVPLSFARFSSLVSQFRARFAKVSVQLTIRSSVDVFKQRVFVAERALQSVIVACSKIKRKIQNKPSKLRKRLTGIIFGLSYFLKTKIIPIGKVKEKRCCGCEWWKNKYFSHVFVRPATVKVPMTLSLSA